MALSISLAYDEAMKFLAPITLLFFALAQPVTAQSYKAGSRAYMTGDYATALKHMRPLAKQGHRKAQKTVGWMYANGRGVAQDDVMAFVWFTVAVENGSRTARINLSGVENRLNEAQLKEARTLAKRCLKNLKSCPG